MGDLALAAASIALTVALVVITAFYAWQTKRTVDELRHARGASLFPKIALSYEHPGAGIGFLIVGSVGMGPAMDVEISWSYEPDGPVVKWSKPVMPVGEEHRFLGPDGEAKMDALCQKYERVVLKGSCKDAFGDSHTVDEEIRIRDYWELNKVAMHIVDTDYAKKTADQVERMARVLEQMKIQLQRPERDT